MTSIDYHLRLFYIYKGNVEYKLKLVAPSPARFARLVTQLKWRLYEGGGQCYYELGVTDNGLLIGLSRAHLEQSLETLEMMAGEIGASVIVVKEIEVPQEMAEINEKIASRYIDFETGQVKRSNAKLVAGADNADYASTATTTSAESDSESPTTTDLFSMDPDIPCNHANSTPTIDLEISSVYKPRPVRTRAIAVGNSIHDNVKRKGHYGGKKKTKTLPQAFQALASNSSPSLTSNAPDNSLDTLAPNKQQTKAIWRRQARDVKREQKKRVHDSDESGIATDASSLIPELDGLHVLIDHTATTSVASNLERKPQLLATDKDKQTSFLERGPRLIVEALVVRKLSLEEAFLDFGGFGFEV
jgi:hypothetical protein